jgi:hypothetical protein
MALTSPQDASVAIVGDGFGSLIVYATAIYLGFAPSDIVVYGTNDTPVGTYQQFAYNLGQTVLRSESESHFLPADWPTFAQLDAYARRSATPLARSIRRRYNPGVPDILAEATAVRDGLGWESRRYPSRIGWLEREESGVPHFVLYDENGEYAGRAKHVMLALGHGPLSFPPALAKALQDPALADRIAQAYAPKAYAPGGVYVVVGAGIAAVNEWANALDLGASVISLLRSAIPDEQDLNTPRCLFEAYGIDVFQALPFDRRLQYLAKVLKGTTPKRRSWEARITAGRTEGRFVELQGEIDDVQPGPLGLRIHVSNKRGDDPGFIDVSGVVAATGFHKSALTVPLFRRLVEHYGVPVDEGRLKLKTNCGVPGLDRPDSRLCVMGIHANTVIPHGDTIAGLKYIGRRFAADCYRAERPGRRRFGSRLAMQTTLASATVKGMRRVRRAEQLS